MRKLGRGLCVAFSMYSRIPVPQVEWNKDSMQDCLCFFPLVGAVIGGLVLFWYFIAGDLLGGRPLFTVVLILIPVLVSGGIHLDGLLDTADALASHRPAAEKLRILKDSHTGAFAVIVGICWFLLYYGVCSEADAGMLRILAVGFVLSRALGGLSVVTFPMAKSTGLASSFSNMAAKGRVRFVLCVCVALCAVVLLLLDPCLGAAALLGAAAVFLWYRWGVCRQFGGVTGDLAGFFIQNCELGMAGCVAVLKIILYGR